MLNRVANQEYVYIIKQAFQYVGYMFRSGPWRDAIVKFGIDPRSDPKYRIYQTMMFQIFTRDPDGAGHKRWEDERTRFAKSMRGKEQNKNSHLFDGKTAHMDGKVWQVCDITDPLLKSLLSTIHLREECDIRSDGWYQNGTWAKAKIIMKAKLAKIMEGGTPSDLDYTKLLEIPDVIDASTRKQAILKGKGTPQEVQWATDIRAVASSPAKRKPLGPDPTMDAGVKFLERRVGFDDGNVGTGTASGEIDPRLEEVMLEFNRGEQDAEGEDVDEDDDMDAMDTIEGMDPDDEEEDEDMEDDDGDG